MKTKLILFTTILIGIIVYVAWIFYMSEPKYTDNNYKRPEKYDFVSVPYFRLDKSWEVKNGLVLQVDSSTFTMRADDYFHEYYQINFKTDKYKVIGRGTFYHKVNSFVGFNIMLITTILVMIFGAIIFTIEIGIIQKWIR